MSTALALRAARLRQSLAVATLLLLTSCATSTLSPPVNDAPPVPVTTLPQPPVATPLPTEPQGVEPVPQTAPPATITRDPLPPAPATPSSTLLASVDTAIAAGDLERAAALCERALRISPRDAVVWYRLASIRYRQQRFSEAMDTARRALSFAGDNAGLRVEINELLQRANAQLN